jgi:hypothetical protein
MKLHRNWSSGAALIHGDRRTDRNDEVNNVLRDYSKAPEDVQNAKLYLFMAYLRKLSIA